jgi:hypothetical protein
MYKYKIYRQYKSGRKKLLFKNQTLEMVKGWCKRGDTRKEGVWMDVFIKQ